MRNGALRLSVLSSTLVAFVVLWATIAARPWASSGAPARPEVDPRLVVLGRWERQLRHEAALVRRTVDERWAAYRKRLRVREAQIAKAKWRYAQRVAAARAAQARIAAMQAAASRAAGQVASAGVARVSSAPAATQAAAAAPVTRIVTLPPQVQVVTLPPASAPATSSSSSRP